MIPTKNRIIGLTAKIGSGKSFVAKLIKAQYDNVEIRAFGDKLKQLVKFVADLEPDVKENHDEYAGISVQEYYVAYSDPLKIITDRLDMFLTAQKMEPLSLAERAEFADIYIKSKKSIQMFHRLLLQIVGTEIFRKRDPDYWVRVFAPDAISIINDRVTTLIIDDVRFPNEADFVKNMDGIIVKIEPTRESTDVVKGIHNHASESNVERIKPDYVIENDFSSIDSLTKRIKEFVTKLAIRG